MTTASKGAKAGTVDMKLEVTVIPVSDWYAEYIVQERTGQKLPD
jgi:hypothetical protein